MKVNKKSVFLLSILFVFILFLMEKGPLSTSIMVKSSGSQGMLEMRFGYTKSEFYRILERLGDVGQLQYVKYLCLDCVFIVVFALLTTMAMIMLLKKTGMNNHYNFLVILPITRGLFDTAENILFFVLLGKYPKRLPLVVELASAVTLCKWIFLFSTVFILLLLIFKLVANFARKRGSKT